MHTCNLCGGPAVECVIGHRPDDPSHFSWMWLCLDDLAMGSDLLIAQMGDAVELEVA